MTDPTAALCGAIASGLCAAVLSELGVTPALLAVAFVASTFGLLLAQTGKSWWQDMLLLPCIIVGSAVLGAAFGPVLARHVESLRYADKVVTLVVGILFHPGFNALAARLPAIVQQRTGGALSTPPKGDAQ